MNEQHRFATRAIHGGQAPDPTTGAVMTPIYATSTYAQDEPRRAQGLRVRAHAQPDAHGVRALRRRSRRRRRRASRSPRASPRSATLLDVLPSGSHVVALDDLYGGTYRLFERVRGAVGGTRLHVRRHERPRALAAAIAAEHADDLGGDRRAIRC